MEPKVVTFKERIKRAIKAFKGQNVGSLQFGIDVKRCDECEYRSDIRDKDNIFSEYPCSVYLHNALWFISEGKSNAAYEEICWVILKSGGKLMDDERKRFEGIVERRKSENGALDY